MKLSSVGDGGGGCSRVWRRVILPTFSIYLCQTAGIQLSESNRSIQNWGKFYNLHEKEKFL